MALLQPAMSEDLLALIRIAVREDMGGAGDLTVQRAIGAESVSVGRIVARQAGVVSGMFLLPVILAEYGAGLRCEILKRDADRVGAGDALARISGATPGILSAERVMLNFLGHLSGIASLTARYVDAVAGVARPPAICDTRKTTPGFRVLDKYAVRCGGGVNHRMGLYDGVMLKDNHLVALRQRLGSGLTLAELTARMRNELPAGVMLWLEVDTLEQLAEALPGGGPDVILLDNFDVRRMREAVTMRGPAKIPLLEASGGVTLETVKEVAQTGVDRISVGALTHSAGVLDLSMEFD